MIVTHAQSADGQCRIYLGGKASLECWIEPNADGRSWAFRLEPAATGNPVTESDKRDWATYMLLALARELDVAPADLAAVPFEAIAALHCADPFAGRRVATPKRLAIEQGFMATRPDIRRPASDYLIRDYARTRTRAR